MTSDLTHRLRQEVEDLHLFISAWFRGAHPKDRALFDQRLTDRLTPGMVNIQPAGRVLSREMLAEGLFAGHAANPAFEITIENFKLITTSPDGALAVATYEEQQRGAKNSATENRRFSTAVFRREGERHLWAHLQETGMD